MNLQQYTCGFTLKSRKRAQISFLPCHRDCAAAQAAPQPLRRLTRALRRRWRSASYSYAGTSTNVVQVSFLPTAQHPLRRLARALRRRSQRLPYAAAAPLTLSADAVLRATPPPSPSRALLRMRRLFRAGADPRLSSPAQIVASLSQALPYLRLRRINLAADAACRRRHPKFLRGGGGGALLAFALLAAEAAPYSRRRMLVAKVDGLDAILVELGAWASLWPPPPPAAETFGGTADSW